MDRRKSLKTLVIGTVTTGVLVEACSPGSEKAATPAAATPAATDGYNRMKEEADAEKAVLAQPDIFDAKEMATITVLCDIIIPKDDVSGSASDAKVPEFIQYIVKEMTEHQTPLKGGLRWLDLRCISLYNNAFTDCTKEQQIAVVDTIAYPKKAKKEDQYGVKFFSLLRDLTATGFYTTEIGFKDVGYIGNTINKWAGVPDDVLKQYGYAYTEKELKECA
jgi:gluconate 2-dehydrogenase gamma chain